MKGILFLILVLTSQLYANTLSFKIEEVEAIVDMSGNYARPIDFQYGLEVLKSVSIDEESISIDTKKIENEQLSILFRSGQIVSARRTGGDMGGGK